MSRKRNISTDISTDPKLAGVAEEWGALPLLLYTWAIPHASDYGQITSDSTQFRLLVCPALPVKSSEVACAIQQLCAAGLWRREEKDGREYLQFPEEAWFRHQSYINANKRPNAAQTAEKPAETAERQETPRNAEHRQVSPRNPVSPSPTLSPSPSEEKDANANALSAAAPPVKVKKVSSERSEQIGQEAVREYQDRYKRAYGTYAEFLQGDAAALKDALIKLGAKYADALDRFFGCPNERVKVRRHAVKLFCGEINVWLDDGAVSISFPSPMTGARASPRNGQGMTVEERKERTRGWIS